MNRAMIVAGAALLLGCARSEERADTMSLATVDTVKSAGTTTGSTTGASTAATPGSSASSTTPAATRPTAPPAGTGTKVAPADTTNLGHDRAIPINTRDPKVRLPTVDTTKRPPSD